MRTLLAVTLFELLILNTHVCAEDEPANQVASTNRTPSQVAMRLLEDTQSLCASNAVFDSFDFSIKADRNHKDTYFLSSTNGLKIMVSHTWPGFSPKPIMFDGPPPAWYKPSLRADRETEPMKFYVIINASTPDQKLNQMILKETSAILSNALHSQGMRFKKTNNRIHGIGEELAEP